MNDQHVTLWAAVDVLTEPTTVPVPRDPDLALTAELRAGTRGVCDVAAYRAATIRYTTIPSLWAQAEIALFGGEIGGGGSKPLRERSIADLDLMEIMSIIRDTTRHELESRGTKTRQGRDGERVPFDQKEMRSLASLVIQKEPGETWWWIYRYESWGRLLSTYLNAAEHAPKPTRLRNTECPLCRTRQLVVEQDGELMVVAPLVVDYRDGYVRCARCEACGATWFRGDQLAELARLVGAPGGEMLTA